MWTQFLDARYVWVDKRYAVPTNVGLRLRHCELYLMMLSGSGLLGVELVGLQKQTRTDPKTESQDVKNGR